MKLAIVGMPGFIDRSFARSTEELYRLCGNNTGNLVFWYAFQMHVQAEERVFLPFNFNPDVVNKCDIMVFIFANHVNPGMDLGDLVEKLERVEVPVVAFGLGAQSKLGEDVVSLPEGSVEFFQALSRKTDKIGLRGEFTKETLSRFGVHNTEVIGCISNFISSDAAARIPADFKNVQNVRRVAVNSDFIDSVAPFNRMIGRVFPDAALDVVVQAPIELLHLSRNEHTKIGKAYRAKIDKVLSSFDGKDREALRDRVYAFYDARSWMEHAQRYDFSGGSRMHGNMVSFQTGTPTVFVPHDSRTLELASTMRLPRFPIADCDEVKSAGDFFANVRFDKDEYMQKRQELKKRYESILLNSGLRLSKIFERI
ncbi:polysaccharide pyruvyl transferase family protein [Nitratireductor sp. ZSWI3]|uniref:polysaccharide pyruvyl transferase family protein n=1 Tax=Nitratireductor sp. ZSWI3 TaxID=2966359 RepID=UPI0021503ADE|nr:polysaccharide pyruvyl transferase family protein [Nitratireductor sp. ZSWI3]MCR4265117.1 polysaccharide pyruvyl transferase family protein [Nitratireductor sp. ZSWI3]